MANLRNALKDELEAAGLLGVHPVRTYAKATVILAFALALFWLFHVAPWWLAPPLFAAATFVSLSFVMFGHDSGHGAVSKNRFVNDLLGYVTFPLIGGLSLTYWRYKHNMLHHSYPNVVGKDTDIDIWPLALRPEHTKNRWWLARQLHKVQGVSFWLATTLATIGMRRDGFVFIFGYGRKLAPLRDRAIDFVAMAAHFTLWLVVPTVAFGVPFLHAFAFYVAWSLVVGVYLGAIFMPAHMTMPQYVGYDENFVLQLRTTQNFRPNALNAWLLIGLDHQIEHHLFQRMSHLNVKRAGEITEAFCRRHNLPYQANETWAQALWSMTKAMQRLPFVEPVAKPPPADLEVVHDAAIEHGRADYSTGHEPRLS